VTDPEYGPDIVNVAAQRHDPDSLLQWLRRLLLIRRRHPEMAVGTFDVIDHGNAAVLAFLRSSDDDLSMVLANFSGTTQAVRIEGGDLPGPALSDAFTGEPAPCDAAGLGLELPRYGYRWLTAG